MTLLYNLSMRNKASTTDLPTIWMAYHIEDDKAELLREAWRQGGSATKHYEYEAGAGCNAAMIIAESFESTRKMLGTSTTTC